MLTDEQHAWLVSTLKINVRVAAASETTEDGKLVRKRGEKYKDEDKKAGWYVDQYHEEGETDEQRDRLNREREMNFRVTDMYTDEKRDEKTLVPDGKGRLVDQDEYPESGNFIYSVGEDGKMVVGEEGAWELREVDTGRVIDTFVTRGEAEERAKNSGGRLQVAQTHHSTLVQGENVSGAGTIKIERGKVTQISNISGHYMPRFEHLLQTVESLLQSGVILNKELVDYQGRKAEEISPDVKKVFKAVQPRLAELPKDKARVMDIIKELNSGTLDSDDTEELETELDKITERVSLVDRAVTALRKMGIGPRNKIRDVDTTFIYAEKAQTGAEFVMSEQKEKMTAQELLMGKQTKKAPPKEEIDISNLGANSYVISEQGNVFGDGRVEAKGNEPTPSELREQEKRKNFRNADPKRAMQDELMDVARQKKLRPEDRDPIPVDPKKPEGEKLKTVFEGTVQGIDEEEWKEEISDLAEEFKQEKKKNKQKKPKRQDDDDFEVDEDGMVRVPDPHKSGYFNMVPLAEAKRLRAEQRSQNGGDDDDDDEEFDFNDEGLVRMPDPAKSGYIKMVTLDEAKEMRRQAKARQRQQEDDDDEEDDDDFDVDDEGKVKVADPLNSGYFKMVSLEEAKEMRRQERARQRQQEDDDDDEEDDDDEFEVGDDGLVKVADPQNSGYFKMVSLEEAKEMKRKERERARGEEKDEDDFDLSDDDDDDDLSDDDDDDDDDDDEGRVNKPSGYVT